MEDWARGGCSGANIPAARIFSSIRKSDGLFWNIVKPEDFGFIDWMRLLFLSALFIVLTFSDSFAGAGWVLQKFNPV